MESAITEIARKVSEGEGTMLVRTNEYEEMKRKAESYDRAQQEHQTQLAIECKKLIEEAKEKDQDSGEIIDVVRPLIDGGQIQTAVDMLKINAKKLHNFLDLKKKNEETQMLYASSKERPDVGLQRVNASAGREDNVFKKLKEMVELEIPSKNNKKMRMDVAYEEEVAEMKKLMGVL